MELGAGFDPEQTGRKNIFLNGALLGFSPAEMMKKEVQIEEDDDPVSKLKAKLGRRMATRLSWASLSMERERRQLRRGISFS